MMESAIHSRALVDPAGAMHYIRTSTIIVSFLCGALWVAYPSPVAAQRRGGSSHGLNGSLSGGFGRPDAVDEADSLKDFHQALAVQATSSQIADFQSAIQLTNQAKEQLDAFASSGSHAREGSAPFDSALVQARTANRKFQEGFSEAQKSGLKEIVKRLDKSDSDLDQSTRQMDAALAAELSAAELSARVDGVRKALSSFADLQLALGREMGIVMASSEDVTFSLPPSRRSLNLGGRTLNIPTAALLAQTAVNGDQRFFRLAMRVDLTDLQNSMTEILRAQLDQDNRCGVRLAVRQASLMATPPTGSLLLRLHFERWSCYGQSSPTELAESDGAVELALTASVGENHALITAAVFQRIDASGMFAEELKSGDLGDTLRDKIAQAVTAALQAGTETKSVLPTALPTTPTLQTITFGDPADGLFVTVEGLLQASNDQVKVLAAQLNQALAARAGAQPPAQP